MATGKSEDENEKTDKDDDLDSDGSHSLTSLASGSDEDLSNTDDEKLSELSIRAGINPCKCCVCEDCDLRQMCILMGYLEAFTWYIFFAAILILGVVSWGSDPELYSRVRTKNDRKQLLGIPEAKLKYDYIKGITLPPISGQKSIEVRKDDNSTRLTQRGPSEKPYSKLVKRLLGDAQILLRFSSQMTEAEEVLWENYLHRYLVGIVFLLGVIAFISTINGFLLIRGAKKVKNSYLWTHTGIALVIGVLVIFLSALVILCECYFQGALVLVIALIYAYLAFCSFGLITRNSTGVYGEFRLKGVVYAYEPTFKTKIAPITAKPRGKFKDPTQPPIPPDPPPERKTMIV